MTLFEECIEALGENVTICSETETSRYFDELVKMFPVTSWDRINWSEVAKKKQVKDLSQILQWLNGMNIHDAAVVLLWNYVDDPAVLSNLKDVLKVIDDVIVVGSDTFIFCPTGGYVIEFYHEGEVMIGITSR